MESKQSKNSAAWKKKEKNKKEEEKEKKIPLDLEEVFPETTLCH